MFRNDITHGLAFVLVLPVLFVQPIIKSEYVYYHHSENHGQHLIMELGELHPEDTLEIISHLPDFVQGYGVGASPTAPNNTAYNEASIINKRFRPTNPFL